MEIPLPDWKKKQNKNCKYHCMGAIVPTVRANVFMSWLAHGFSVLWTDLVFVFFCPQIKTLRKCALIKEFKRTDSKQRCVSVCGPCKHTSVQSSRFLAKNPFSSVSLHWFPLLKTNATARYLSLIRGYLYGSYLKVTHEMRNKLFLLCGASVSFLFLF